MADTIWTMTAWVAVGLFLLFFVPAITYMTVRLGTAGFLQARKEFQTETNNG